jgi:hypothetical protein
MYAWPAIAFHYKFECEHEDRLTWCNRTPTFLARFFSTRYSARMRPTNAGHLVFVLLIAIASKAFATEPNWTGEYADKNLLNGQAAFQLSIEQSGNTIRVLFDAAYADAHGAAPDGEGPAKITGKGVLSFKWEDSFKNSGTGTIIRTAEAIKVSIKATRVADPRCLVFYGENMRLKRVK